MLRNGEDTPELSEIEFEHKNLWKCCGYTFDKRLLEYCTQMLIILIALIFCMYEIIADHNSETSTVWISLISAIVGNFLPRRTNIYSEKK